MKAKSVLSYVTAAGMTAAMFGGMQLSVSAAADQVTFWDVNAESATTLNSTWTSYDANGDNVMDVVFDDESDTVTFNEDITLRSNGLSGTYYTCISSGSASDTKSMTINIPKGVTVTMDNTNEASGWSTALNGTSTGDLTITGGGKLVVKGGGGTASGQEGFGITPYEESITIDGVEVTAEGKMYGVGYYKEGSLTIQNGGSLEATGGTAAFESGSTVNAEGAVVTGGDNAGSASEITADQIASYKYVKIATESSDVSVQPSEEPSEEPVLTSTGIRIGEDMIYEEDPTWENNSGVRAEYDKESDTLTLSGTGSITGPGYIDTKGCGAAIYADKPLNIIVDKDADITLNTGTGNGDGWVCGIYTQADNADITIGGEGKLTVNSMSENDYAIAICPYGGKFDNGYDLTLKGSVDVTANGSAYGVYAWQGQAGWIRIIESASFKASGGTKAVYVTHFQDSYIYGGNRDFIGSVDNGEWDADKVADAKTISVRPALFSQQTSGAITGNDQKTGFVTVIKGTAGTTIKSIKWRITSPANDGKIQELSPNQQPQITLGDNAQAVFAVIVENLKDEDATAYAIAE